MARRRRVPGPLDPRSLNRLLQASVLAVLLAGLWTANVSVVVNATLGFLVTLLPALVERDLGVPLPPLHAVLISGTVLLHAAGLLGPYHAVWWWDHVTHLLAAGLVAASAYVVVAVLDERIEALYLPTPVLVVVTVLATVAAGVAWEVLEFVARLVARRLGQEPVLVQYGLEDTMKDLLFDTAGGVLVAGLRAERLRSYARGLAARTRTMRES